MTRPFHGSATIRRVTAALLLAALFFIASLSSTLAHAGVVRSDPPDGSVSVNSPHEIRLWFNEAFSAQFLQVRVLNAAGEAAPGTSVRADPADPTLLIVTLPELGDGVYTVAWAVVSEADGHTTRGSVVYAVAASGASPFDGSSKPGPAIPWDESVLRWLNYLALGAVAGAVTVGFSIFRPGGAAGSAAGHAAVMAKARRRVLKWGGWWALVAVAAGLALLYRQAALFASPTGPADGGTTVAETILRLLGDRRLGPLWGSRQALLLGVAALLLMLGYRRLSGEPAQRSRWAPISLGLLCVLVLTTQALSGHAAALAPATTLAVLADVLHLASASVWVGGLLALAAGLLPAVLAGRGTPNFGAIVLAGWRPFGRLAALSVGVLAATGLYSMGREVASPEALLATAYGRALIVKVALVFAAGCVGLLNSSLLHPAVGGRLARAFGRPASWRILPMKRFSLLLLTEISLGVLALLATGLLTAEMPPHGPEFAEAPTALKTGALSQNAGDVRITLDVVPGQPGRNSLTLQVADAQQPPAEILRVIVHFTFQGRVLGTVTEVAQPVSPGVYRVDGDQLSLAGPWQVEAVVRRKGLEDSATTFLWTITAPGSVRPVMVSNRALEPATTIAAGVLGIVVLAAGAVGWLRHGRAPA